MKALLFQHGSERFEALLSLSSLGLRMPVRGVSERSTRTKLKRQNATAMGLVDGLPGPFMGGLDNDQQSNLLSSVAGLLQGSGGIQGLMQKFNRAGLGDLVKGWVRTGPNLVVSPQQVERVFGAAELDQMAAQTGIARDQIASHVAETLREWSTR
jgi:uncharacterized protein YidB (DUF937 family)